MLTLILRFSTVFIWNYMGVGAFQSLALQAGPPRPSDQPHQAGLRKCSTAQIRSDPIPRSGASPAALAQIAGEAPPGPRQGLSLPGASAPSSPRTPRLPSPHERPGSSSLCREQCPQGTDRIRSPWKVGLGLQDKSGGGPGKKQRHREQEGPSPPTRRLVRPAGRTG